MSTILDLAGLAFIVAGIGFLLLAAVALWRLPDIYTRLHALTKADTAGLALIAFGAALLEQNPKIAVILAAIVILIAISGATSGHLIARMTFLSKKERSR